MRFHEWRSQLHGQLFAVIDAALDQTLVARFYETGGEDAYPLFAGTAFADQAEQGPWLLPFPSSDFIDSDPQLCGFYVVSNASSETVRKHWQSLIEVAREGEVMWFRYADNRIFSKMLGAMSQRDLDDILGPCAGLWVNESGWRRSDGADFIPRYAPWFRIQPHHLAPLYDENRHAYILRRRLWQTMTAMMERHPDPEGTILPVLKQANQDGLQEDVRDGVVAGALALQAKTPLEEIRAPLMLADDELAQVVNWLNKRNELTGVC